MLPCGIDIEQADQVVTVRFTDDEVPHTLMQEAVVECIERMRYSAAHHFVFDLSNVGFLASACIGILVGLLRDAEHVRGRVAIANCADNVALLFRITRLDQVFVMAEDAAAARAAL